jgi:hypothetical protein
MRRHRGLYLVRYISIASESNQLPFCSFTASATVSKPKCVVPLCVSREDVDSGGGGGTFGICCCAQRMVEEKARHASLCAILLTSLLNWRPNSDLDPCTALMIDDALHFAMLGAKFEPALARAFDACSIWIAAVSPTHVIH